MKFLGIYMYLKDNTGSRMRNKRIEMGETREE